MKIISITNQKGGVGKTTTAINLSACLAELGVRVLLIDLDPQANASSGLGVEVHDGMSIYTVLLGQDTLASKIQATRLPNLSIITSEMALAGCEIEMAREGDHLGRLRGLLQPLKQSGEFDFVLIDTPPSLGILMTSALAAADGLLIPIQCEYFGLEGLAKIVDVHQQIRDSGVSPHVTIEGILMTMYDQRTNLSKMVIADVRRVFEDTVYQTVIPRSVRLGEAPSFGKPIIEYDAASTGAEAYRDLAREFLQRQGIAAAAPSKSGAAALEGGVEPPEEDDDGADSPAPEPESPAPPQSPFTEPRPPGGFRI
ncbi:MAG: ParA family protein [Verrucomicrobiales bacterium]